MIFYLHALTIVEWLFIANKISAAGGNVLLLVHPFYQDTDDPRIQQILREKFTGEDLDVMEAKARLGFERYSASLQTVLSDERITVIIVFEAVEQQLMDLEAMLALLPSLDPNSEEAIRIREMKEMLPPGEKELLSVRVTEHVARLQALDPFGRPIVVVPTRTMNSTPYRATWTATIESLRGLRVKRIHVGGSYCALDHRGEIVHSNASPDAYAAETYGCVNETLDQMRGKFERMELIPDATQFRILPAP